MSKAIFAGTLVAAGTHLLTPWILPALVLNDSWHGHGGLEEEYGFSGAIVIEDPADPNL